MRFLNVFSNFIWLTFNNNFRLEEQVLYAEDMLKIQKERNRILNEIEQMELQVSSGHLNRLETISDHEN